MISWENDGEFLRSILCWIAILKHSIFLLVSFYYLRNIYFLGAGFSSVFRGLLDSNTVILGSNSAVGPYSKVVK